VDGLNLLAGASIKPAYPLAMTTVAEQLFAVAFWPAYETTAFVPELPLLEPSLQHPAELAWPAARA